MFNYSFVRIAVVTMYFLLCSACGTPADDPSSDQDSEDNGLTATDINFVGGGSQTPDLEPEEEPYRSPTLSGDPPPTMLTWIPTIEQAVRLAEHDRDIRIIVWAVSESCDECPGIERDVFTDPDVIAVSREWYFVNLDVDRNAEQAEYLLHGADPPALVFLDNHGYEYDRYYGTFTAAELENMLIRGRA